MAISKEEAKERVKLLIDKFNSYKGQGLLRKYNEDNTCKDFILPLFRALGWGVETSREVEGQKIVSGGRVDYAFYLDGIPKFYLEAKAISEDLNKESFIKQAIDYAYNKGVTWAVLSNFEGIKVFNSEWHTTPAKASVLNLSVNDYLTDFDLLWELSKEGFQQELLYERARKIGQVAVKEPVGERLYKDLTVWRELFFKYITAYHRDFNFAQVDEIIQRILNRFVFIRTCEDRGIEKPYLLPLAREWRSARKINLQQKIKELFRDFDTWYNSKLFTPHLCDEIDIEDTPYAEVIEGLYGSKDEIVRYDFNAIGVDVLGRVYEQYLGYVAKTVEPKRKKQLALEGFDSESIKIEKEKKRRKEQGIYYTPTFIVDYIVKNALKPVLGKCTSVDDLKKIKVLDPACGSGSFLIKALEVINDKYKEFNYAGDELTKIQILNENIYGVDLDEQAVEITRLNLLLNSLDQRMELPLLKNIRNGNSLISGTDEELKKYFGENFRDKKPFNWQEEFPEVFKQGGFDVVIGNPPWGAEIPTEDKDYFKNNFISAKGIIDTFALFIEKSANLLKDKGYLGFILPDIVLLKNYPAIRKLILNNFMIKNAVHSGMVFKAVNLDSAILILEKEKDEKTRDENKIIAIRDINNFEKKIWRETSIKQKLFKENEGYKFNLYLTPANLSIKEKIDSLSISLGSIGESHEGIHSGNIRSKLFIDSEIGENSRKLIFRGDEIQPYSINWGKKYVNYDLAIINKSDDEYANLAKKEYFETPKIFIRRTGDRIIAAFDEDGYYASNNLFVFQNNKGSNYNYKYLLAFLNSRLMTWYFLTIQPRKGRLFAEVKIVHLNQFPIFKIDFSDREDKSGYDHLTDLADKMILLNKKLNSLQKGLSDWETLHVEIEKVREKIDQEVYQLYDLTPEEIEIVEKT